MTNEYLPSVTERALALLGVTAAASALVLMKTVNPSTSRWFPVCLFYEVTGLACPGCGATRGMHALLNGDFVGALDYNAMLIIIVPALVYAALKLVPEGIVESCRKELENMHG